MGRLHIPIGRRVRGSIERLAAAVPTILIATAAIVIALSISCPSAIAQDAKFLPYGQTHDGRVTTDGYFFVQPNATAPATIQTRSCISPSITIQPGLGAVLRNLIDRWTCSLSPEFGLIPAPAGVDSYVNVSFNFPTQFSFRTGPIGSVAVNAPRSFTGITSDDVDWAIVHLFPSEATTVYLQLNDAKEEACDTFIKVEQPDHTFKNIVPLVVQCEVKARGVGTLRVYMKKAPPCGPLCVDPAPIPGLVTNGRRDGVSSLQAFPF
jgi:hypothetical protein